jgi:hypothetical protein
MAAFTDRTMPAGDSSQSSSQAPSNLESFELNNHFLKILQNQFVEIGDENDSHCGLHAELPEAGKETVNLQLRLYVPSSLWTALPPVDYAMQIIMDHTFWYKLYRQTYKPWDTKNMLRTKYSFWLANKLREKVFTLQSANYQSAVHHDKDDGKKKRKAVGDGEGRYLHVSVEFECDEPYTTIFDSKAVTFESFAGRMKNKPVKSQLMHARGVTLYTEYYQPTGDKTGLINLTAFTNNPKEKSVAYSDLLSIKEVNRWRGAGGEINNESLWEIQRFGLEPGRPFRIPPKQLVLVAVRNIIKQVYIDEWTETGQGTGDKVAIFIKVGIDTLATWQ